MPNTATRNQHADTLTDTQQATGIDTDVDGQFSLVFDGLRRVLDGDPSNVNASAAGGYVINPVSVSGNEVTFEVYYGGGAGAELDLVTGTAGVTDVWASAVGE